MNELPTLADYEKAEPLEKGFMSYTFAQWPGSQIPEANPFKRGTKEYFKFNEGVHSAVISAQDSEE